MKTTKRQRKHSELTEYEYPLKFPNCVLYRKNGDNPIQLYALWDGGGCLEVYRSPDDSDTSLISINILEDSYIYWGECLKKRPNTTDYVLEITRPIQDVNNPKKIIFKKGEEFTGLELRYVPPCQN